MVHFARSLTMRAEWTILAPKTAPFWSKLHDWQCNVLFGPCGTRPAGVFDGFFQRCEALFQIALQRGKRGLRCGGHVAICLL